MKKASKESVESTNDRYNGVMAAFDQKSLPAKPEVCAELLLAALDGEEEKLDALLTKEFRSNEAFHVNFTTKVSQTMLAFAANNSHLSICKLLVEKYGADPNIGEFKPINNAVAKSRIDCINYLLPKTDVSVHQQQLFERVAKGYSAQEIYNEYITEDPNFLLHLARLQEFFVLGYFLKRISNKRISNPDVNLDTTLSVGEHAGKTIFWFVAAAVDDDGCVRPYEKAILGSFLNRKIQGNINAVATQGEFAGTSPFWWLTKKKIWYDLRKFPEANVNVAPHNPGPFQGQSALLMLARYGDPENKNDYVTLKYMANNFQHPNFNVVANDEKESGRTALWYIADRFPELTEEIVKKYPKADINAGPTEGESAGMNVLSRLAVYEITKEKGGGVEYILKNRPDANVNASTTNYKHHFFGKNLVTYLAYNKKWDLLDYIIENFPNADINETCEPSDKKTALWIAADNRKVEIVYSMLKKHSDARMNFALPLDSNHDDRNVLHVLLDEENNTTQENDWSDNELDDLINSIILIVEKFPESITDHPLLGTKMFKKMILSLFKFCRGFDGPRIDDLNKATIAVLDSSKKIVPQKLLDDWAGSSFLVREDLRHFKFAKQAIREIFIYQPCMPVAFEMLSKDFKLKLARVTLLLIYHPRLHKTILDKMIEESIGEEKWSRPYDSEVKLFTMAYRQGRGTEHDDNCAKAENATFLHDIIRSGIKDPRVSKKFRFTKQHRDLICQSLQKVNTINLNVVQDIVRNAISTVKKSKKQNVESAPKRRKENSVEQVELDNKFKSTLNDIAKAAAKQFRLMKGDGRWTYWFSAAGNNNLSRLIYLALYKMASHCEFNAESLTRDCKNTLVNELSELDVINLNNVSVVTLSVIQKQQLEPVDELGPEPMELAL